MLKIALTIFGIAAVIVGMLGFRGQLSKNRPWHVFWDMKYQPRYIAQSTSSFFADGRTMRTPVSGTVAYTSPGYFSDAGSLTTPNLDLLKSDPVYFRGLNLPLEVEIEVDVPKMENGKPVLDANKKPILVKQKQMVPNWVKTIPLRAIEKSIPNGERETISESDRKQQHWLRLMQRGREQYNIHCAVCHGLDGYGGQGEQAHGMLGRKGMVGIANYHQDKYRDMADGEIFNTISNGKNSMSAYGHQIKVQDRWAIVAYIRALQLSQNAPEPLPVPKGAK
jgi:mono/diheme cytochrome c family protein